MKTCCDFSGDEPMNNCPICDGRGVIKYFGVAVCEKHWKEHTGLDLDGNRLKEDY
jgi:hypothetical protein